MANNNEILVELKKASEPLAKFLEQNYNPMCKAIVTVCGVEVVSCEISTDTNESYDKYSRNFEVML